MLHFAVAVRASVLFIHLVVSLTTGPKPLSKRARHIVRSRAFSFRYEYPLLSLRSSSSFLRLYPLLPVTSIPLFIYPSITCCRRQFLRNISSIIFLNSIASISLHTIKGTVLLMDVQCSALWSEPSYTISLNFKQQYDLYKNHES
jgi:hypothetical protein